MSRVVDCTNEEGRAEAVRAAAEAVRRGEVVVLPTDTVYGIGADAFDAEAVAAVLEAKGRGRDMPPPVLVPNPRTVDGLATGVPDYARELIDAFWPGPLTLVLRAQPSLRWDLGETNGTVAVRMPREDTALALLEEVGPMAVTSANRTGEPAAKTVTEAAVQLGSSVSVYLDAGPTAGGEASTILDCTGELPVVLRDGALSPAAIREVLRDVRLEGDEPTADVPALDEPTADEPSLGEPSPSERPGPE